MKRTPLLWLVVVAAAAGVVLRIVVWVSHLGRLEADEATVGLMAERALHGQFYASFPSQQYGGTLEPILTAPLVGAFGMSTVAVRTVPFLLAALASLLTWRIGRRTIGEPGAMIAGALFWIAPAYWIWMSERARSFYESSLVLELLALLLVLRLRERDSRVDAALLGLVAGLAWWETASVWAAIGPALVWLVLKRRDVLRQAVVAFPAFLVGGSPWLVSQLRHDWWFTSVSSGETPYIKRVRGFLDGTLPMSLNARVPFHSHWLWSPFGLVLFVALIAAGAAIAWRTRRTDISLLPAIAIPFGLLAAISPFTWRNDEPRYDIPLMPVLALLLCAPVRTWLRGALVLTTALALTIAGISQFGEEPQRDGGADVIGPLLSSISQHHITALCSTYQIAYRVDFFTNDHVTAAECDTTHLRRRGDVVYPAEVVIEATRFPDLARKLAADRYPAWVFLAGSPDEIHGRPLLQRAGYHRTTTPVFAVYAR